MMASEFDQFECANAGASQTYPVSAGSLKVGGYICIGGHACKIDEIDTSQPGKHGHAKVAVTAHDIFGRHKTREEGASTGHTVEVPFVKQTWYQLLDIEYDGTTLSLMDDEGETRQDLDLPEDEEALSARIRAMFASGKTVKLLVVQAMGCEQVMNLKEECGK